MASTPVTHDTQVAADAQARLAQQYQKAKIQALIAALCVPAQDLEDALFQVYSERWLSTAQGAQLDVIGRIVGQPRDGFTDQLYADILACRIKANLSSGGPEELYATFIPALPVGGVMSIVYHSPASFVMTFGGAAFTSDLAAVFATLLRDARAAGVGGQGVYSLYAPSNTFTLDGTSSQALDHGHLAEAFN